MEKTYLIILLLISGAASSAENILINPIGKPEQKDFSIPKVYLSSVYAGKNTYGMRANAVVAAFKGNSDGPFDFPILGFPDIKSMGSYSDRDSVTLYADNTSAPYKSWERIKNTKFTPTSVESDNIVSENIKVGMILDTDSSPKWSTYVTSVQKNKITTAGWVNIGNQLIGTPKNGTDIIVNPLTKIWATNFNVFMDSNGRATSAVIQENGMVNNKVSEPITINGIDNVILPQSKFGGTAAFLARGANTEFLQRWKIGFDSQGSDINFLSTDLGDNTPAPSIGFSEASRATDGMVFSGANVNSSITWKHGERVIASIDPEGLVTRQGYKIAVASSNMQLSDYIGRYLISAQNDITLKLPDKKNVFPGYTLKLTKVSGNGKVVFTSSDSYINGSHSAEVLGETWNKEAIFDGTYWYVE
ncbi:hypothetical protein [Rouxiella sp. WC2420]|uniref:Uncharacterized protein n=1 Tax=Rouxiella sp. WC2420 TaxID=3234145 RepID=A0AB39VQI7_9GAMM